MDDGSPIGYLISIFLLILGGAYFAGTEIALASVNRIRMMSHADNGNKRAARVLYILDHFDKALTTLLIGNNIMHIGCASIATLMATKLWGVKAVPATTVVMTVVVFFVSEMVPKRFAKACNERFALAVSGSLLALMKAFTPISFVFSKLSAWVSKPFKKQQEEPTVTEDELYDIIETIAAEGAIDEEKSELVQSALEFSDTTVRDVLTPWEKVVCIPVDAPDEAILSTIRENAHSRLPVVDEEGHPIGVLLIRKYLADPKILKGAHARRNASAQHHHGKRAFRGCEHAHRRPVPCDEPEQATPFHRAGCAVENARHRHDGGHPGRTRRRDLR